MSLLITAFVMLLVSIPYASVGEWILHRHVMHAPVGKFTYPYKAHALTHHRIFGWGESYHLVHDEDKHKIRMAWWNGPVIVVLGAIPLDIVASLLGFYGWQSEGWIVCIVPHAVFLSYYIAYEFLHWCMHLPKKRRLELSRFFRYLNGHHLLHHRYWMKNLNVVIPIADRLFGTLLLRSPIRFAQAGSPVPNVQPL